eukprot:SAG11_NODE_1070_length_5978_cov_2.893689_4_plen_680_part_00
MSWGNQSAAKFFEGQFRKQVDAALVQVKKVLGTTRAPVLPADCEHVYEDKYLLAEQLTSVAVSAEINCLELLGIDEQLLRQLHAWSATGQAVTLRFTLDQRCDFDRVETREVTGASQRVTTEQASDEPAAKKRISTVSVVTTVNDFFWFVRTDYRLVAYKGVFNLGGGADTLTLRQRASSYQVRTATKDAPEALRASPAPAEVEVSWLLGQIDHNMQLAFNIDRSAPTCRTPRRNAEIHRAHAELAALQKWARTICKGSQQLAELLGAQRHWVSFGRGSSESLGETCESVDMSLLSPEGLFVPVLPCFEPGAAPSEGTAGGNGLVTIAAAAREAAATTSVMLPLSDAGALLAEQRRSLAERLAAIVASWPPPTDAKAGLCSQAEAALLVVASHMAALAEWWMDSLQSIEALLTTQLVAALGKHVGPSDFEQYMLHHAKRLLVAPYRPQPFCFPIRRPGLFPDGVLSLESTTSSRPVHTICRQLQRPVPMEFDVSAATTVRLGGEQYLHTYLGHSFAGSAASLQLVGRARQFSTFLLLVGKLGSANTFEPKHGVILQNKDCVRIPLLLEQIPTAKEFRRAVESLSPEMRAFASSIRSMQLEGTVFAVAVIQVKPALERVLNLPAGALTKQIELTEDLLELFIKYQVLITRTRCLAVLCLMPSVVLLVLFWFWGQLFDCPL